MDIHIMNTCAFMDTPTHSRTLTHVDTYTYPRTFVHSYREHLCVLTDTHTHSGTLMHTGTHTATRAHIHIHSCAWTLKDTHTRGCLRTLADIHTHGYSHTHGHAHTPSHAYRHAHSRASQQGGGDSTGSGSGPSSPHPPQSLCQHPGPPHPASPADPGCPRGLLGPALDSPCPSTQTVPGGPPPCPRPLSTPPRLPGLPGTHTAGRVSLVTRAPEPCPASAPVPEPSAACGAWLDSAQLHPSSIWLTAGRAPGALQPGAGCTPHGTGVPVAAAGLKQEGPSLWPSLPLSWPLTHRGEEPAEPAFHNTPQRRRGRACTGPVGAVAGSLWEPRSPCQGAPCLT